MALQIALGILLAAAGLVACTLALQAWRWVLGAICFAAVGVLLWLIDWDRRGPELLALLIASALAIACGYAITWLCGWLLRLWRRR